MVTTVAPTQINTPVTQQQFLYCSEDVAQTHQVLPGFSVTVRDLLA